MISINEDILNKITEYDTQHGTNFTTLLSEKINRAYRGAYYRGIVHGLCLALTDNGIITNYDALDILDLIKER